MTMNRRATFNCGQDTVDNTAHSDRTVRSWPPCIKLLLGCHVNLIVDDVYHYHL